MSKLKELLTNIDTKKQETFSINFEQRCHFIYHSLLNAGYKVALSEVEEALTQKQNLVDTSVVSSYSDVQQIICGFNDAFTYALSFPQNKTVDLSETVVKRLHHLIFSYTENPPSDEYRTFTYRDEKTGFPSPKPEDLPHVMAHLSDQFFSSLATLHPVELAAMMTKRVLDIQAFPDGNSLLSPLMTNLILHSYGYQMLLIPFSKKEEYDRTLATTRTQYDMEPFSIFIAECLLEQMGE